ncbi:signal transduction histidine kinase [Litoreibacter halocynthiae]|uniref:histidine kinase n=1 Tax=Litoreibacter halocynthiae TaxID=1242689 RepID=A0A4R7LH59_9RHOB|nr:HAMP domain-containing sensor histidine kinase [Litoreibacter halocynthiae]TDT73982.1 signal transduction histidine kinase [Litoreibacter halocynthiae]
MLSLRRRAMIGGALSAMASILVGAFVLLSSIENNVLDRFDRALADRHSQLVVALNSTANDPTQLEERVYDPAYTTPYSGRYWQITSPDGQIFTSTSMFDAALKEPFGAPSTSTRRSIMGPAGEPIRAVYQKITLEDGSAWGVSVAESLAALTAERQQTRRSLLLAFVLVGLLGLAGAFLQTTTILHPLDKLRRDVAKRWEQDEDLTTADYPEEVAPLVDDINELLARNRDIIARARRQAADLAHALKTPTAILRNELALLAAQNHDMEASVEALDRVDAQLGRSLARMRAANSGAAANIRTDLSNSVARFTRLFTSMAERDGKTVRTSCAPSLSIRMDQQDIEEVIGNLLDNALKWCKSEISLTAHKWDEGVEILIEDDGPGIPEGQEREALKSGGRLDSSKPGTGLGLAIAIDLLQAYGAELNLEKSAKLGGLAVRIFIPGKIRTVTPQKAAA